MVLNPDHLIAHEFAEIEQVVTPRDASLYALGIGIGDDPLAPRNLRYLYEGDPGFRAVPTQPVTMGFVRWVLTPGFGIDVTRVVHGEERLTLHGPVPTEGLVKARLRIVGVEDKGEGRGALVSSRRDIRLDGREAPFATIETTTFCRGDGGCGSAGETATLSAPLPDRMPDTEASIPIRPDAALIYRLSGDLNPLHVDPAYAARAGFDRPILHGLCTLGIAARAVWDGIDDPAGLRQIGCRFSGVVFPGDTLTVQTWRDGDRIGFRARAGERTVIDNASAVIA